MRNVCIGLVLSFLGATRVFAAPAAAEHVLAAPGLVEPASEERLIGSEVIGTLREVKVEENDVVKSGAVLAVIDNDDQTAALAQAKAAAESAAAALRLAELNLTRKRELVDKHQIAISEFDQAAAERDMAKGERDRARATVALAQANLDKTIVTSPIDGTILRRYAVAGEAVTNQPPTPICSIGDLAHLRVRAEVDEIDIGRVKRGQDVVVKADGFPGREFPGRVIRVNERLGVRKALTDRSSEREDSKVLPVLVELEPGSHLPVGLRVDVFFSADKAQ
jgi:HlyD family secretion protein